MERSLRRQRPGQVGDNHGVRVPEIRTDRLLLRGWQPSDLAPFAAMNADPAVMHHFPALLDTRQSAELVDRFRERWRDDGHGPWAVQRLDDARFIGLVGLARPRFDAPFMPAVEVGWRLARDAWGNGFATEAARASLAFGFEGVGLDEIVSFTAPVKVRSRAVMERLGMTRGPADDFDHPRLAEDSPLRGHVLYRLRRADWEAARLGSSAPRELL
jgi:RimJ/RimL family protein N-acetyltransferase